MKKKILFTVLVGMLILTTACSKKKDNKVDNKVDDKDKPTEVANTNDDIIKNVNIDGLEIQNVALVINDGKSTYTADVINTTEAPIEVLSFNMSFADENGNELSNLLGYVGKTLNPGESSTITSYTETDLTNAVSVTYTRN